MAASLRISQKAYFVTVVTFLALAVTLAVARILIRINRFRRVFADDYFLFLALAALIGTNALSFITVPKLYRFADASSTGHVSLRKDFVQTVNDTAVMTLAAGVLCWTTISAVKFSVLFYFRALVEHCLPKLMIWWRIVLVICFPVAITSMCSSWIVCPDGGSGYLSHCFGDPGFQHRARIITYYSAISDIVTDALILSIPIILLRHTHLQPRQKLNIAFLLLLSLFMIATAVIRGISTRLSGIHDEIWASFWFQLQASTAVIMVSAMIFKSLFMDNRGSILEKNSEPSFHYAEPLGRPDDDGETGATTPTGMEMGNIVREDGRTVREDGRTVVGSFGKEGGSQVVVNFSRKRPLAG